MASASRVAATVTVATGQRIQGLAGSDTGGRTRGRILQGAQHRLAMVPPGQRRAGALPGREPGPVREVGILDQAAKDRGQGLDIALVEIEGVDAVLEIRRDPRGARADEGASL